MSPPCDWPETTLGSISSVIRGVTYTKSDARSTPEPGFVPLLRATNIGPQLDLHSQMVYVPEGAVSSQQWLRRGDIVVTASSGSLSVVGKNAVLKQDWVGTFGAFCAVVRPHAEVDAHFLALQLTSDVVRRRWSSLARGTNINNLKRAHLLETPIALPPLVAQRRIAEVLDDHLSRLDAGSAYLAAANGRAGACAEAWLQPLLKGHEARSLQSLLAAPLANGRSVPTAASGFDVLRLTALADGRIDLRERKIGAWTAEEARPFTVAEGDYLVSRGNGSLQRVAVGGLVPEVKEPVAYPDTMIRIRPRADLVLPEYFGVVWNSRVVRRQIEASARTTAGIYKVNQQQLEQVTLPVPSLADQCRITHNFNEFRSAVEIQRRSIDAGSHRARVLRQALLAAAFSGGLTASTQPNTVEEMLDV